MPQWQQRIPNFEQQICANVRLLQEDLQLLDELIESEYQRISQTEYLASAGGGNVRRFCVVGCFGIFCESKRNHCRLITVLPILPSVGTADQAQLNLPDGELVAYRDKLFCLSGK